MGNSLGSVVITGSDDTGFEAIIKLTRKSTPLFVSIIEADQTKDLSSKTFSLMLGLTEIKEGFGIAINADTGTEIIINPENFPEIKSGIYPLRLGFKTADKFIVFLNGYLEWTA